MCSNLKRDSSALRHMSCRCLVAMAEKDLSTTLNSMLIPCLKLLSSTTDGDSTDEDDNGESTTSSIEHCGELGSTELIYLLVEKLGANLIGIIPLLAVPILAGMSSSVPSIR